MVEIFAYVFNFNGNALQIIKLANRAAIEEYNQRCSQLNTTEVIIWDIDREFLWLRMPEAAQKLVKMWGTDRGQRFNNVP